MKEAKDFVEALIPGLKEQYPDRYAALPESEGAGCASVILVCVGLTSLAIAQVVISD